MNRQAQAVVLLLFGGAILRASFTDLYLRYVKEGLRPFLIAAGVMLVAAAAATLWYDLRPRTAQEELPGEHEHHGPGVGWLLILPVLGLLLVAPPALGSYAAGQSGTVLAGQSSGGDYPPLPAGEPVDVTLLDYASRAVFDEGRTLTGRSMRLTGFVTLGPDGQPMRARSILSCWAADGRPIKVGLSGDTPAGLPPDTWVTVIARYDPRTAPDAVNQAAIPYAEVVSWERIEPPRQQYE